MSHPEWPAEDPWSAEPAPAAPAYPGGPAAPAQPSPLDVTAADTSHGAPSSPAPAYPAPTSSTPPAAPAYPAQPVAFGHPGQPAAPAYGSQPAMPGYGTAPRTAEFPAPVSGYPNPAGGVPASGVPASPAAAYPMAGYPAPAPYPRAEPGRKGRAGLIVVSILAALFLVSAAGTGYLYLSKSKDYNTQATQLRDKENTISNQAGQITTLTDNLANANQKATTDESQLTNLNTAKKALSTCVADYDDLFQKLAKQAATSTIDKAFNKVDKDCAIADRYRD